LSAVSAEDEVFEAVRKLAALDLEALRGVWREHFGPPPKLRSHDHLRRLLAWRMQAEALGGMDQDLRRALMSRSLNLAPPKLHVGTRVSREWRGVRYEVEIGEDGVLFQGSCYRSLSQVAREITGVRWNGPRFFGLRQSETSLGETSLA
jgi:hypothetical protein